MKPTRIFRLLFALTILAGGATVANAQNWAAQMFVHAKTGKQITKHDFGVVARGADVRHRFPIKNKYKQEIHISNVRTTCGCSAATPSKTTLASGETIYVEVTMNTRRFSRRKDSNLIVTFDRPSYAEVRIPITAYIRTDVVLTPGAANFGAVDHGAGSKRSIDIAYAGRADWKIRDVKIGSKFLAKEIVETRRAGGQVNYRLTLTLDPKAPVGSIREQIVLVTDDANSPFIPILVQARVEADVTVTVSPLGTMTAGSKKTFNVVVRGKKAFAIDKIESKNAGDRFKIRLSKRTSRVHVLPISFTPPNTPGAFKEEFTITIAGRPQPVTFQVTGRIAGN